MLKPKMTILCGAWIWMVACSDPTTPPPVVPNTSDPIVGTWLLKTWNGKVLPAVTYGVPDGYNEQRVSERFVVVDDGSFSIAQTYRYMPEGKTEVRTGHGVWKKNLTGYSLGAGLVPATLASDALTVEWRDDGETKWVYAHER